MHAPSREQRCPLRSLLSNAIGAWVCVNKLTIDLAMQGNRRDGNAILPGTGGCPDLSWMCRACGWVLLLRRKHLHQLSSKRTTSSTNSNGCILGWCVDGRRLLHLLLRFPARRRLPPTAPHKNNNLTSKPYQGQSVKSRLFRAHCIAGTMSVIEGQFASFPLPCRLASDID